MTEPSDAERDERAERWRRAKPILAAGYAAGVPGMFASRRNGGAVIACEAPVSRWSAAGAV